MSSTPRATSPARPVVVPSIDELLEMSDEQLGALSVGSLKEVLFKNHVTARMVVEKSELVERVRTLVDEERAERERKEAEEAAERAQEEEERREREREAARARAGPSHQTTVEDAEDEDSGRPTQPATSSMPRPQAPTPPPPSSSPPANAAPKMTPKAQAMASRLERTGLCVICQDEEANIAIVDCG